MGVCLPPNLVKRELASTPTLSLYFLSHQKLTWRAREQCNEIDKAKNMGKEDNMFEVMKER